MFPSWLLFLISVLYVGLLFAIATYGDRAAARRGGTARKPWVYSLALGVYCTSWTFYGAVGRAASSGWDFLPIYLGPMLVFLFGHRLVARVVALAKRHNITSIADFIGARYGRHSRLSMLVTLIALFGVLPYIALQLKAVAFSFETIAGTSAADGPVDSALLIAVLLAVFAILFGTRHLSSRESHHGMVLAIAFESVCKLLAFLAVGAFATWWVFGGMGDAYAAAHRLPQVRDTLIDPGWQAGFLTQTLLAAAAILCLPRQFHVAVVENTAASDLGTARWLFPAYLGLISLFVLPVMAAGLVRAPAGAAPDTYVLAIPQAAGLEWLTLAAYLGGFSAATSMVIVASIALATMLCNEVIMPALLRMPRLRLAERQDLSSWLKTVRRVCIVSIIAAAWLYYRLFAGPGTLTSIGLLSFAAVIQFLPGLVGGIYSRRASARGAMVGLVIGFGLWFYTLLLPVLLEGTTVGRALLDAGPLGIGWLRPRALFGLEGLDSITHGTLVSLAANLAAYLVLALLNQPGLSTRLQVARFLDDEDSAPVPPRPQAHVAATVGDLRTLVERFFGAERSALLLDDYAREHGSTRLNAADRADPSLARHVEHLLAGALGAASARLVLSSTLAGRDMQPEDVIRLLDETSHAIQFSEARLRATLEHLSQGVSVVDRNLRLVAWNQRYLELFGYPAELISVGRPIEEVVRYNASRGLLGENDADTAIARRLQHMREGHAYTHQREMPDGAVIEIRGNPMPGGGFVTSYSDVTAYKRTERELLVANETLEDRVEDRTRELTELNVQLAEAKAAAERADDAKTRFLAAASHDLAQPLNAARLFASSIDREALPAAAAGVITQIEHSLSAAENLLSGLLDISRLDAQAQEVRREHFRLADVLDPLAAEFTALAGRRGLRLRRVPTRAVAYSDPRLLRRILQNLLSNALRYTDRGSVLLGVRRYRGSLRIEVWDTGRGIPDHQRQLIFEEFRRLGTTDADGARGLGLGLAISDRLARVLGHALGLRSWPGRGSVFHLTLPRGSVDAVHPPPAPAVHPPGELSRRRVLCLDNEPAVLEGMRALLGGWGCEVLSVASAEQAQALARASAGDAPDLLLVDYHLDGTLNGVAVAEALRRTWNREVPGIVITADHTLAAREDARQHGYAVLPKPVKPAALRALMTRLLDQART